MSRTGYFRDRAAGIEARHPGVCDHCDHHITPGQRIVSRGLAWVHVECAEEDR